MLQKKALKDLTDQSFDKDDLREEDVLKIADYLKRSELKKYIKALKAKVKQKSVVITLPFPASREEQEKHKEMYPGKKIIYEIDPSLFVGMKIQQNDTITEYDLKDTLENLQEFIVNEYD